MAPAVGIYGARGDEPITEESPPGSGFLASLGREWEKEALAVGPQTRVVLLRSGIALDKDGGALPLMALPFRFFVGGPLGSGRQYLSWIHRDDWVAMVSWALTSDRVAGPLNVTAPNPVTNAEFARTLGRVLQRPALLPVPAFALRVVVGEMAGELVTGQRVLPEKSARTRLRVPLPTARTGTARDLRRLSRPLWLRDRWPPRDTESDGPPFRCAAPAATPCAPLPAARPGSTPRRARPS